jgi:tRNA(Arg) A34 adenosine deaminase TadA
MDETLSFDRAWDDLDPRFRECLRQAWAALTCRGLPVGSVISRGDAILAVGRNRVYDKRGGSEPLQRTPLAHAEMNAIATIPDDANLAECEIWSTQAPCSMCRAAVEFTQIGKVHFLATDPGTLARGVAFVSSGRSADLWLVVANTLFLHNVAAVGGLDNPMLAMAATAEPEVLSLALGLVQDNTLIGAAEAHASIEEALTATWDAFRAVTTQRSSRASES